MHEQGVNAGDLSLDGINPKMEEVRNFKGKYPDCQMHKERFDFP
jgi:hypothetical protein